MARIVLFGAGDIARLAHHYFTRDSDHEVVAFTVDRAYREGDEFCGLPLVDFEEVAERYPPSEYRMFVALSYAQLNALRAAKYEQAKERGYELVSYVSSRCSWLTQHPHGDNCFILEDNTIQPFVRIGNDVTLWSGNHLGHDSIVEDHAFLSSHVVVSGHCVVKSYCFLGVNATLHNGVIVAERTLVAAGAVIAKETEAGGVYVPARSSKLEKTSDEIDL